MNKKEQRAADKAAKLAAATQIAADAELKGSELGDAAQQIVDGAKPKKAAKVETVVLADGTTKTLAPLPSLKKARKPKTPNACSCGCGGMTKGGRFIAGHDSRLKGWLLRVERGLVKLEDIPEGEQEAVRKHMAPLG